MAWVSSTRIYSYRFLCFHPLRLSPHSPLHKYTLQIPLSSTKSPSALTDKGLRVLHAGLCSNHICRSHSVLPDTDQLLNCPLIALERPLLSQFSLQFSGLHWMQESFLTCSCYLPRGRFLSFSLSLSYLFLWRSFLSFKASLVTHRVKHLPVCGRHGFDPGVRKILWRRKWQSTLVLLPGKIS